MESINIIEKLEKLAQRKEYYDLADELDDQNERIKLYVKARELADDVYTSTFIDYLKSKPIGHELWSDDTLKAIVSNKTSKYSRYERIVKFVKKRRETSEEQVYFGSDELELLKSLDDDALKLYCDLSQRRTIAKREVKQLERALKTASAVITLYHLDNKTPIITLKDGRTIQKDYYMGKSYVRVD